MILRIRGGCPMQKSGKKVIVRDLLISLLIIGAAVALSMGLAQINNDNNPFAMAVFILAVALVARFTSGYFWGIATSVVGTFCVNYFFTYPFWSFDVTYPGYPLTIAVMLIVSILVSALTTQIKKQEQIRYEMDREKMHANLLRAIAHDIRTPLSSILGASSALQEQELSSEAQASLIDGIQRDAKWLARIRTALRHTRTTAENDEIILSGSYHVGDLEIDYKKLRVLMNGKDVHLTPNEYKIVALLGKHAGRVLTYKYMLRELWGPSASLDNKILRVHMASIRRKIEPDPNEPRYIFTEVGVGYRMAENE